jgi:hypothetical protein
MENADKVEEKMKKIGAMIWRSSGKGRSGIEEKLKPFVLDGERGRGKRSDKLGDGNVGNGRDVGRKKGIE